jgi:hypothetical protein
VTGAVGGSRRQFWTGMRFKSMKPGVFGWAGYVPAGLNLFSLGRTAVIIDNER